MLKRTTPGQVRISGVWHSGHFAGKRKRFGLICKIWGSQCPRHGIRCPREMLSHTERIMVNATVAQAIDSLRCAA